MTNLPRLSITDRHRLKALTLQSSAILPQSIVWFCQGRKTLLRTKLSIMAHAVVVPALADTILVSDADYVTVKGWIG